MLYRDYLHHTANFCTTVYNMISKEIICNSIKCLKQVWSSNETLESTCEMKLYLKLLETSKKTVVYLNFSGSIFLSTWNLNCSISYRISSQHDFTRQTLTLSRFFPSLLVASCPWACRPGPDSVDSLPCHVIDTGYHSNWLDCSSTTSGPDIIGSGRCSDTAV